MTTTASILVLVVLLHRCMSNELQPQCALPSIGCWQKSHEIWHMCNNMVPRLLSLLICVCRFAASGPLGVFKLDMPAQSSSLSCMAVALRCCQDPTARACVDGKSILFNAVG